MGLWEVTVDLVVDVRQELERLWAHYAYEVAIPAAQRGYLFMDFQFFICRKRTELWIKKRLKKKEQAWWTQGVKEEVCLVPLERDTLYSYRLSKEEIRAYDSMIKKMLATDQQRDRFYQKFRLLDAHRLGTLRYRQIMVFCSLRGSPFAMHLFSGGDEPSRNGTGDLSFSKFVACVYNVATLDTIQTMGLLLDFVHDMGGYTMQHRLAGLFYMTYGFLGPQEVALRRHLLRLLSREEQWYDDDDDEEELMYDSAEMSQTSRGLFLSAFADGGVDTSQDSRQGQDQSAREPGRGSINFQSLRGQDGRASILRDAIKLHEDGAQPPKSADGSSPGPPVGRRAQMGQSRSQISGRGQVSMRGQISGRGQVGQVSARGPLGRTARGTARGGTARGTARMGTARSGRTGTQRTGRSQTTTRSGKTTRKKRQQDPFRKRLQHLLVRYPVVVFPLLQLRIGIRKKFLGEAFWVEQEKRRKKELADIPIKVRIEPDDLIFANVHNIEAARRWGLGGTKVNPAQKQDPTLLRELLTTLDKIQNRDDAWKITARALVEDAVRFGALGEFSRESTAPPTASKEESSQPRQEQSENGEVDVMAGTDIENPRPKTKRQELMNHEPERPAWCAMCQARCGDRLFNVLCNRCGFRKVLSWMAAQGGYRMAQVVKEHFDARQPEEEEALSKAGTPQPEGANALTSVFAWLGPEDGDAMERVPTRQRRHNRKLDTVVDDNWLELQDPESGDFFVYNPATGERGWDVPRTAYEEYTEDGSDAGDTDLDSDEEIIVRSAFAEAPKSVASTLSKSRPSTANTLASTDSSNKSRMKETLEDYMEEDRLNNPEVYESEDDLAASQVAASMASLVEKKKKKPPALQIADDLAPTDLEHEDSHDSSALAPPGPPLEHNNVESPTSLLQMSPSMQRLADAFSPSKTSKRHAFVDSPHSSTLRVPEVVKEEPEEEEAEEDDDIDDF